MRITAQLIDALSEEHLWAATYDRTLEDIFDIQSDVAARVAGSIPAVVLPKSEKKDTDDLEAYTLYLKATQILHQGNWNSVRHAISMLEKAVSSDPGFVRAQASLAIALQSLTALPGEDPLALGERSESIARRALELGPEFAESHVAMAVVHAGSDRREEAVTEAEKAVQINPSFADAYLTIGMESTVMGRIDQGLQAFKRGYELDPLYFEMGAFLAFALEYSSRREEALDQLDRLSQVFPKSGMTYVAKARMLMAQRRFGEAQDMLDKAEAIEPGLPFRRMNQGVLFALTGRKKEAEGVLKQLRSEKNEFLRLVGRLNIQSALGNFDDAFAALEVMGDKHLWDWVMIYNPLLSELQKDPRFDEFRAKVGLPPREGGPQGASS